MTTTTNPTAPLTHAERLARFSAATPTINPIDAPSRRTPPKARRNSVKHRAIR